jgi:predicted permease
LGGFFSKDDFTRKIYVYGLCFSNYGFMGLAVVKALFPEVFMEYSIYLIPLWIAIYAWAVPALLIPAGHSGKGVKATLTRLANPMFVCMIIGIAVGVTGLGDILEDTVVTDVIDTAGACMSPLAMILTGVTIAKTDVPKVIKSRGIYIASLLRLVVIPVALTPLIMLLPIDNSTVLCALCALAMPLGLSPVVVPAGYGEDTSIAAGMAIVSHALSIITIPLVFAIFSGLIA